MKAALLGSAVAALAAVSGLASAQVVTVAFPLSGAQEVNPGDPNGFGTGIISVDFDSQTFDLDVFVGGIDLAELNPVGPAGDPSPIHIHLAPIGASGPIVVNLGAFDDFDPQGLGIMYAGRDIPFSAFMAPGSEPGVTFEQALAEGRLYVNIHTFDFPGGAIRGQIPAIVPAPAGVAAIGAAGLLAARRRRSA